jgi:hypothetical protein
VPWAVFDLRREVDVTELRPIQHFNKDRLKNTANFNKSMKASPNNNYKSSTLTYKKLLNSLMISPLSCKAPLPQDLL